MAAGPDALPQRIGQEPLGEGGHGQGSSHPTGATSRHQDGCRSGSRVGSLACTLRTFVERRANGDVVALLKDAVDTLQRRADDERRQLDTEFERISQGNTSDGDLSEDTHHSVLIIEAGLVLAGAPEAAVIVEAAVLVAECLGL